MRRPHSLALRLTLLFGIVTAIVFSGFGWITERSIEHHFDRDDVSELKIIAQSVQQALSIIRHEKDVALLARRFDDILVGHHHALLQITRQDGLEIFTSTNIPDFSSLDIPDRLDRGILRRWSDGNHAYRVLIQHVDDIISNDRHTYTVIIAVAIDSHQRFLASFRDTLWIMIVSGIVITSLMGWIAVRRGHAPLYKIIAQIRRISVNHLQTRLNPKAVPRELGNLAVSFNEMLERIEEAFQRLSNFSADIAHELRTPITNLMTQAQVTLSKERTISEYQEILYSNIEEYERMALMIEDMLFLAQSDNALDAPDMTEVDLTNEIHGLFDYYEAWVEEHGVSLALEGSATVLGNKLMLRRALSNLLSNAVRYTQPGQTVYVRLTHSATNDISISIENPGEAIPPEHIPKLFDRFYRIDPSRQCCSGGTGLGLAIVKSIIDAHQGKIDVTFDKGYTRFKINFNEPHERHMGKA
ncbi:MAG: heavy metal sensor histidine kinase [Mariprofundaceae bacterium]|nr:heavy metal sensor histidine kinase [Mariprofundaceae bacterium]